MGQAGAIIITLALLIVGILFTSWIGLLLAEKIQHVRIRMQQARQRYQEPRAR